MADSTADVGDHVAVAVDSVSGTTFIAYYDPTWQVFELAWPTTTGGNCGTDNSWYCYFVDWDGNVGLYPSISLLSDGNGVRIFASYYDLTNGSLKYMDGYWQPPNTLTVNTYTIDVGIPTLYIFRGLDTALDLDSQGNPHIAYRADTEVGFSSVLHAYWVGDGSGDCGSGAVAGNWQCDSVVSGIGYGRYIDLDLDQNDRAHIGFFAASGGYPMVVSNTGPGGDCGPGNTWSCRTIVHPGEVTGEYLSMYVEDGGWWHLAYYNQTNAALEYATYAGSGGNCGLNGGSLQFEWQCDWIDDIGTSISPIGIAITHNDANHPVIAYQDISDPVAPAALKVARPVASDASLDPNCGPVVGQSTWNCSLLDGGGSWTSEAYAVAIDTDANGIARIAYKEHDSYYDKGNLKCAFQPEHLVFADGFESGGTNTWSKAVP